MGLTHLWVLHAVRGWSHITAPYDTWCNGPINRMDSMWYLMQWADKQYTIWVYDYFHISYTPIKTKMLNQMDCPNFKVSPTLIELIYCIKLHDFYQTFQGKSRKITSAVWWNGKLEQLELADAYPLWLDRRHYNEEPLMGLHIVILLNLNHVGSVKCI